MDFIKKLTKEQNKIEQEEQQWKQVKQLIIRKNKIKQEKQSFRKPILSTSKILIIFLFLNCTIIEIFTGFVTIKSIALAEITYTSPDFSPLVALIGSIVSEVIGYAIYSLKAAKENTAGGVIYDLAMQNKG